MERPGQRIGKGQEIERLVVYSAGGKEVAVAHIWTVQPDAKTGRELHELAWSNFIWSPNGASIANFGNVPHFSAPEGASDSLAIEGKQVYPTEGDGERHWFRSPFGWSPDSKYVALVDERRHQEALYLAIVRVNGSRPEYRLGWRDRSEDWPPVQDFSVFLGEREVTVKYRGAGQAVAIPDGVPNNSPRRK